jgi:geranylgeranylglycerol-phosphate geranylgeranyltransferase
MQDVLYNNSMRKIKGLISLLRPELALSAGLCVLTGQILAYGGFPSLSTALLGFFGGFALSASALVFNDVFDLEVDRVNTPQRALPSGAVSPAEAVALGVGITLAGLAASYALGTVPFILAIPFWFIGFLYNWRFKKTGLPGNLMVSASVAITFIFGAASIEDPWNGVVWVFSLMAFFIDFGEEIAGDAMDMAGDSLLGSRSIALRKGRAYALRISAGLWVIAILLSYLPLIFGWLGWLYGIPMTLANLLIVFFTRRLLRAPDAKSGVQAMRGVYLSAILGIAAFLLGLFVG